MPSRFAYGLFVLLGFVAAAVAKRAYERDHGSATGPHGRALAAAALVGAFVGAKVGMVLYESPQRVLDDLLSLRVLGDGKTVIGAIAGGFLAVEFAKLHLGVERRTGDAYSVALPLGVAIGRIGCAFGGCCYGRPTESWASVWVHGAHRYPAPIYESALLFAWALVQHRRSSIRRPLGDAFRETIVGMAVIRIGVDFLRGDAAHRWQGMSAAQWVCVVAVVGIGMQRLHDRRSVAHEG